MKYTVKFYGRNREFVLDKIAEHTFEAELELSPLRQYIAKNFSEGTVGVDGITVASREVSYFTVEKV